MTQYYVVKFTILARLPQPGGLYKMIPTDVEFRYHDNGNGIEPVGLYIAGDLFTVGSACDRMRTDK